MASLSVPQLKEYISEILEGADLNSLSSKKVRQMLEEKLGTDLSERKKEIDDIVMEMISANEEDSPDEKKSKKKAANGSSSGPKGGGGGGKKRESTYSRKCKLSPELAAVVGAPEMARHDVVKKMWEIVKTRNLYDQKNKQFAICDDQLMTVFGVRRFRTFGMMKYLKTHISDVR